MEKEQKKKKEKRKQTIRKEMKQTNRRHNSSRNVQLQTTVAHPKSYLVVLSHESVSTLKFTIAQQLCDFLPI